ncbi:MAG: hypothetical protein JZU65_17715, partial [Chlorobium sp.]|nr:hypothetical protein [Chlorobium sp.]
DTLKNKQEVVWFVTAERELLVAEKDLALGNIDEAELAAIQSELTALKRDPLVKQYLLARERHVAMKKMKPYRGDNTNLSGMSDLEAQGVFASLPAEVRTKYEALANKIDAIIAKNRQTLVDYELESQDTVDAWAETFEHYIPLMREDMEEGMGIGSGFSVKGSATQSRTGSHRKVVDVLANILKQRETAITRGEKAIISKALVGLVEANPNKDFWSTEAPLMKMKIDPVTGLAQSVIDPSYKNQSHVVTVRMLDEKGKIVERSVVFNQHNKRALRLADALKNKDVEDLGTILGYSAKVTRFFSAMNTQYNIIFGVVNQVRDAGEAMLALTATPIAGHQKQIAKRMATIIPKLYQAVRAESKGTPLNTEIAKAWRELQVVGGTTGFRDMFETSADRTDSLRADIKAMSEGKPMRIFRHCKQWVSDYNDVLENSTRLATYMEGIAAGMTQKRAAQLAKDITINFNRKGKMATQAGAMYAFFNASMQGGEKLYRTMTGPGGKKILAGGLLLGAVQAVALAAAGFGDDEPPEFVRERSIVIPIGGKKYVTIPMPLGFHVIPNLSRVPTEFILNGMKDPGKSIGELISVFAEAFNPIGNAGMSVQSLAPTAIDPLIALSENKDWTGMPIAKEDFNRLKPTPGHTRGKTTASVFGDIVSRALNYMTGGNEYVPGLMSPTPDQIDFLVSQAFGGVGRETMKATQVAKSVATGEEVATHRIPLVGRFFGNANDSSSTSKQFYENIIKINRHDLEIDGMRADHINPTKYIADHPEARMIKFSEDEYRAIQKMQKTKRELMRNNGSKERIKMIELQLRNRMDRFNERYESLAR